MRRGQKSDALVCDPRLCYDDGNTQAEVRE